MSLQMLLSIIFFSSCLVNERECCTVKRFAPPILGMALKGHLIKTLFITEEEMCEVHCYLDATCQSINLSPRLQGGTWECELSNSDDKQHPGSLMSLRGYKYFATVNPCNSSPCVKSATCRPNFLGDKGFQCICPTGFTGEFCSEDIDECTSGAHNCSSDGVCINSVGSFTCSCVLGFTGNGTTCIDIDECSIVEQNCASDAVCANTVGCFACSCSLGFTGYGTSCTDIDECTSGAHNCSSDASCANSVGSFVCSCSLGFTGNGTSCTDIDECTSGAHNCSSDALCANSVGSFTCSCSLGFTGNGTSCTDIDECTTDAHNCSSDALCANSVGTFACSCKLGFIGNGTSCTDINECTLGAHNCSSDALCANLVGAFACSCKLGFTGNGTSCTDIDECTSGAHNCSSDASCVNSVGSFTCSCSLGFTGNGTSCTDIDECTIVNQNCSNDAVCVNSVGSFACSCSLGFTGNGTNCTDVDECAIDGHSCSSNAVCNNSIGSYNCSCNHGFTKNGSTCISAKGYESSNPADSCADVLHNTPGSVNGAYYLITKEGGVARTYCHMENITGCGGGGWTLVMKINGDKQTFSYDARYWSDEIEYNPAFGKTGFDSKETKMPSYWSTPFTRLCLGMKVGETTRWTAVHQEKDSLFSLLAGNVYQPTNIGKQNWKSLLDDSSLQGFCNKEGFNVVASSASRRPTCARIGIIANDQDDCGTVDSRLGFGTAGARGGQYNSNSCGNEDGQAADGKIHIRAHCYILIQ